MIGMEKRKRVTQREVAELAGVSQGVVSMVLNNAPTLKLILPETRARVLSAVRKLNYQVNPMAKQLRLGKSELVNVVSPVLFSHLLQHLIPQIEQELTRAGFRVLVSRLDGRDPAILESARKIMSMDFAGTIVLDHFDSDDLEVSRRVVDLFGEYERVVFLRPPLTRDGVAAVEIDYAAGMVEAVSHLAAGGCRHIALALNDRKCQPMLGRLDGYRRGLRLNGLAEDPGLIWVAADAGMEALDGTQPEFIARGFCDQVVATSRIDAVITSNDEWAVALIKVLRAQNVRVPADIAVVGYGDNPDLCWACEPELSSINHGERALARQLVAVLLDAIADRAPATGPVVASYLVPRQSSPRKYQKQPSLSKRPTSTGERNEKE